MAIWCYGTSSLYGTATYSVAPVYTGPYPRPVPYRVLISGVDVSGSVEAESLVVSSVLTAQIDTCRLTIKNAHLFNIKEWDEIKIYDNLTRIFAGFVQTIDDDNAGGGTRVDANLSSADYSSYLDHIYVLHQWTTPITDAAILQYLFSTYWPAIDTNTFVSALKTYPRIRFNRLTLRQVLDQLAEAAGGDWYIDYDTILHFFYTSSNMAPFGLSSAPDMTATLPFGNMVKNLDGSGIVNRVEVVGGKYLSDNTTIYIQGTGQDKRALLPFFLHAQSGGPTGIQVWRNDGTVGVPVWTPMTVKVGYIDTLAGANEVLFYFQDKVLEQQAAWPNLTNAIKIDCRYEVPLRSRYTDQASYAFYNNTYFNGLITNPDIIDKETAHQAALGKLAKSALGSMAVSCDVYAPGLFSGMLISVVNANLGISDVLLIQRVTCQFTTGGYATWRVSLGIYRPDLIDFIIRVARKASSPPVWREDEVLDESIPTTETLALAETTPAPTPITGPYKWGVDARADRWDFSKWG